MERLLRTFLYSVLLALISLFSVSFFWEQPLLLTLILALVGAVVLFLSKKKEDIYLFIFISTGGALAEMVAIAFGAWTYNLPNISGIPYWLPFLWGVAGLFIKRIADEIHDYVKHR